MLTEASSPLAPRGYYGSLPALGVAVNNITGMTSSADGKGYLLVGANGGTYAFGDARFSGSLPALGVAVSNIVGIVPTADGGGYWMVGADGGIFAFGDATYIGSLPALGVSVTNIVGIVPTADGRRLLDGGCRRRCLRLR